MTYPKFLLSLRCHETFLGFLGGGSLFETFAHLGLLQVLLFFLLLGGLSSFVSPNAIFFVCFSIQCCMLVSVSAGFSC